jgi:hypothetical protein
MRSSNSCDCGFFHGQRFSKTHDLGLLIESDEPSLPSLSKFASQVERLTDFAVESRYPGDIELTDVTEYDDLALIADAVYELVLEAVPLGARP